jgi:hypothetical protein
VEKKRLEQLEELRKQVVTEGLTYQEQFAIERKGNVEVMVELARRWEEWAESDWTDVWKFFECQGYLLYRQLWKELDAEPKGLRGLFEFFGSPYFGYLPLTYISSQLYADILTDQQRAVRRSDSMIFNSSLSRFLSVTMC